MHFVTAKSILTNSNGFNIYRGCTHGCIYCDARSDCYHTPKPSSYIKARLWGDSPYKIRFGLRDQLPEPLPRTLSPTSI